MKFSSNIAFIFFIAPVIFGIGSCGGSRQTETIELAILNTAPTSACPNNGITIQAGLDANNNHVLEASESSSTQYVCNGMNGSSGLSGASGASSYNTLLAMSAEPTGKNCSSGGSLINAGLDTNRNSVLDPSEITSFNYICNGSIGYNGVNGASGSSGNTGSSGTNGATGTNGVNGTNGTNGSTGINGTNGLSTLITITQEPAGTVNCLLGGTKISSGLDVNNNSTLENNEVSSTSYICVSANGLNGTNGTNGTNGAPGAVGSQGTTGARGDTGAAGPPGGNFNTYAFIYNVSPQEVKSEDAVTFDTIGVISSIIYEPTSKEIQITSDGIYSIAFSISTLDQSQFAIFINGALAQGSVYSQELGSQQNNGQTTLLLSRHDGIALINYGSRSSVRLIEGIGTVNASISIQMLSDKTKSTPGVIAP